MAAIARNFGAKIIKNTDDNQSSAFKDVIECGITMIAASDAINEKLREEGGFPPLYYRISADYGRVEVARSITSPDTDDLFWFYYEYLRKDKLHGTSKWDGNR